MSRISKLKISWRREKEYTSHVTLGGGDKMTIDNAVIHIVFSLVTDLKLKRIITMINSAKTFGNNLI